MQEYSSPVNKDNLTQFKSICSHMIFHMHQFSVCWKFQLERVRNVNEIEDRSKNKIRKNFEEEKISLDERRNCLLNSKIFSFFLITSAE